MMPTGDRAAGLLLLAFAGFVVARARDLVYWNGSAPGPGFAPLWLGVLLALASLALIAGARAGRPEGVPALDRARARRLAAVVALTAGAAALSAVTGLVLVTGLFMAAVLTLLRPARTTANLTLALLTPPVVWLLFVRWLAVPLPTGFLGF